MNTVGIFGGTFDPVHYGHIALAKQARDQLNLDKVIFIPARQQPFKLHKEYATGKDRVTMLELAFEEDGCEGFEISLIELKTEEISYTINTLRRVRAEFSFGTKLYFILGTDAFMKVHLWRESEELLKEFSFAVGVRPGYKGEELNRHIDEIFTKHHTEIICLSNSELSISSTDIKEELSRGKPISRITPKAVERYIIQNDLYK